MVRVPIALLRSLSDKLGSPKWHDLDSQPTTSFWGGFGKQEVLTYQAEGYKGGSSPTFFPSSLSFTITPFTPPHLNNKSMEIPELAQTSPCASLLNKHAIIDISDDGPNSSGEGGDSEQHLQDGDASDLENEHVANMDISNTAEAEIDCHTIWEADKPAKHEASPINHLQGGASNEEFGREVVSLVDPDNETDPPGENLFSCEKAQADTTQSVSAVESNTSLLLKELASIRSTQAAMQIQLCRLLNESNSRDTSHSTKRKQYASPSPPRKRQRKAREVNIRATRAWLQFDDEPEPLAYIWRNGRSGHTGRWMSSARHGNEQVDGAHLLLYGADLSVELRANGDWLPVTVRLNERTDRFEGMDSLDGKIFEIDGTTMLNVMCGVVGNCGRVS